MCLLLYVNDFSRGMLADLSDNVATVNTDATSMQVFFKRILWIIPCALVILNRRLWLPPQLVSLSLWNWDRFEVPYYSNREQMSQCIVWSSNCSWRFTWRWNSELKFSKFKRRERNLFIFAFDSSKRLTEIELQVEATSREDEKGEPLMNIIEMQVCHFVVIIPSRIFLHSLYRRSVLWRRQIQWMKRCSQMSYRIRIQPWIWNSLCAYMFNIRASLQFGLFPFRFQKNVIQNGYSNRRNRFRRRSWNGSRRMEIISLHPQYNCLRVCRGYFPKNNSSIHWELQIRYWLSVLLIIEEELV